MVPIGTIADVVAATDDVVSSANIDIVADVDVAVVNAGTVRATANIGAICDARTIPDAGTLNSTTTSPRAIPNARTVNATPDPWTVNSTSDPRAVDATPNSPRAADVAEAGPIGNSWKRTWAIGNTRPVANTWPITNTRTVPNPRPIAASKAATG
jgi:hypothetical protein